MEHLFGSAGVTGEPNRQAGLPKELEQIARMAGKHKFRSSVKAGKMLWIAISNMIAIVCTFGLMLPWAQIRLNKYLADNTFFIPSGSPAKVHNEELVMKRGGIVIVILFLLTIITAVSFHNFLHLPPAIGMMTGLAYLKFFGYYLKKTSHKEHHITEHRFDLFKCLVRLAAMWTSVIK